MNAETVGVPDLTTPIDAHLDLYVSPLPSEENISGTRKEEGTPAKLLRGTL